MPESKPFKGVIKLDVRDSKPDWTPYELPHPPKGAPNVLIVLYDDTGLAAWSPFGGRINMPTLQKLADNGLMYSQWHTTALCSPTRSTFLTGRNHNVNRCASIMEGTDGFPGAAGRLPAECATIGQVLQDNGFSTFWLGKNHNVPDGRHWRAAGASRSGRRRRGSIASTASSVAKRTSGIPISSRTTTSSISRTHRRTATTCRRTSPIRRSGCCATVRSTNPSKPWFMWFCPGANHAPHHSPKDYADKYKGKFDDGYEAYREWALKRMIEKGLMPKDTELTPINPLPEDVATTAPGDAVRPWNTLNADEKKLFARMAEVYAGFSEYTDVQVGRIIEYLETTKQLDNTLIFYCADNGASGEGTPNGSVNENKFFNGYPDDLTENLKYLDVLGGPETYNHYPTGWAVAFSTPFQMFKRYSQFSGGTCDPLVIHWPKGIKAKGEVRNQYHHSTDIVPTILDCVGLEMPKVYRGVEQYPLNGVSMRYSFDDGNARTTKKVQYYSMLGTRGIWKDGWKAAALHTPISGAGHFDQDGWELYHVDEDRSESRDLAKEKPEKLKELIDAWFDEADKNFVLPLDDRTPVELLGIEHPTTEPPRTRYIYFPHTSSVPESVGANVRGRSYKIIADVTLTSDSTGVIFAHGSRFGGHALFIKNRRLHYVYNFLGIKPEQKFVSKAELSPGKHTVGMAFIREKGGQVR